MPQKPRSNSAVLVIDQGTHASRALLFALNGDALYESRCKIALRHHAPHQVEQDTQEILDSIQRVTRKCLDYVSAHGLSVVCAGLATQRSTVVAWDRETGQALYPALSWQDTRAQAIVNDLWPRAEHFKRITGLPISPHYGASKLNWLLNNVSEVSHAAEKGHLAMGPLSSFLLFHLVAEQPYLVDHGNAARTLLWNINSRRWDQHLLQAFEIDRGWLPETMPIRFEYGRLRNTGIPITAVNGDQSAALYGHGPSSPQSAVINMGTGAFIVFDTRDKPTFHAKLLTGITDSDARTGAYCLEGTVNGAGAALRWARESWGVNIDGFSNWDEVKHPPTVVNSVGGLGSPWWFAGSDSGVHFDPAEIDRFDTRDRIAAIMESIVFMISANLHEIQNSGLDIQQLRIGGGLSRDAGLCQRLSNLMGLRVSRSTEPEITARGIGWQAAGYPQQFQSTECQQFKPRPDKHLEARFHRSMQLLRSYTP